MDNINLQRNEATQFSWWQRMSGAIDEFGADIIYLVKGEKKCSCDRYRFRLWKSGDRDSD